MHEHGSEEYSVDDLEVSFFAGYPKADTALYKILFHDLRSVQTDNKVVNEAIKQMAERETALKIAKAALMAAEGLGSLEDILPMVQSLPQAVQEEEEFVTDDLQEIIDDYYKQPGLRWRLSSLNGALGSLRKGNFGFVFARPETGKTTFLASEVTFMSQGLPDDAGPIIWFNNEQAGKEVKLRLYQACLGLTNDEVRGKIGACREEYQIRTKGKILLKDNASISKSDVERICRKYKPSLVIFDQIDKIRGFAADRNDLELKTIYIWARELAKTYCPVIGVCQAGSSGEGKKWLTMNDVDNSKTGKQGEADWILGIGATGEMGQELLRYLFLSKNKLHGDEDTDPNRRHDKWAALIKPDIGRYVDLHNA